MTRIPSGKEEGKEEGKKGDEGAEGREWKGREKSQRVKDTATVNEQISNFLAVWR